MKHQLRSQRLGALFAAGWLLLNFPLLALWDSDASVGGIPIFPLALFGIWAGLITTVAWWMEATPTREADGFAGIEPGLAHRPSPDHASAESPESLAAPPSTAPTSADRG